jgi:hypothetical protein
MSEYNSPILAKSLSLVRRYPIGAEILLALLILALIFLFLIGRYLNGDYSIATGQDNTFSINPLASYISKTLASGEIPYRINLLLGGLPLYNWPQFSWLYPFYLFAWGALNTPMQASLHVHYVSLLHVLILLVNTYLMLRIFGLKPVPSMFGALLFAFSRNTESYLVWMNIIAPYAWFPLAIGAIVLVLENRFPRTGIVLGTISVSMMALASPSQSLIHFVFCTVALIAGYACQHPYSEWQKLRVLGNIFIVAVASIAIASPVLVPLVLSNSEMIRWLGPHGSIVGYARLPLEALNIGAVGLSDLTGVLFPEATVRLPVGNMYMGAIPVFLAIVGASCFRLHWLVATCSIAGLFCLLLQTGKDLGLIYISHGIPFWNMIREPGRHLVIFLLFFGFLAAYGFQFLWHALPVSSHLRRVGASLAFFLLTVFASYWTISSKNPLTPPIFLIGSFLVFIAMVLLGRMLPPQPRLVMSVFSAILVIYSTAPTNFSIPLVKDGDLFSVANRNAHEVLRTISEIEDIGDYRLVVEGDRLNPQFWSMNGIYYGISSFTAYFNPMPHRQFEDMYYHKNVKNYFTLLGARYYLCRDCSNVPYDYTLEREILGYKLFVSDKALPRYAFFTKLATPYNDKRDFLNELAGTADFNEKAFLDAKTFEKVRPLMDAQVKTRQIEFLYESRSVNRVLLVTQTSTRGILILNEYYSPEWHASLNGKEEPLLRVNWSQMGILLPPGKNQVRFEYRPKYFPWLFYMQGIAVVVLIAYAVVGFWSGRQQVQQWLRGKGSL